MEILDLDLGFVHLIYWYIHCGLPVCVVI